MWPKKQVNKPLLKPTLFCQTLCRGQNLEILLGPFAHCLQTVWRRPTQNCRSKKCRLGACILIWKWTKLSESYGTVYFTFPYRDIEWNGLFREPFLIWFVHTWFVSFNIESLSLKFGLFEKGTKFEKNFIFDVTNWRQILSGRFFQILCPSQKVQTLAS